jgi:hypothetical protein
MMTETPYEGYEGAYFGMPPRNVIPKPLQKPHPPPWAASSRRETTMVAARLGMGSPGFAFETPEEASSLLPPTSLVIGIEREGEARAYPSDLLSYHEVVNDVVGGLPVAITWCPICQTALGFERRVGDRVLTFGVSGYLYLSNLVLFDRETGSLWNQLLGGAITGRMRGESLRPVPVVHETWAEWLRQHPDTRVLSIRRDRLARKFTDPSSDVTPRALSAPSRGVPLKALYQCFRITSSSLLGASSGTVCTLASPSRQELPGPPKPRASPGRARLCSGCSSPTRSGSFSE